MAKILSFRSKSDTSAGSSAASSFVADETEKLSFLTGEDGAVRLDDLPQDVTTPVTGVYADPKKDWGNQELADLFRVRQLLSGAGVAVETLRGVTDEGDPWFLFCHPNGDVFIHMARIDGIYVLDSPNVQRPLRGADFNELIADFSSGALPSRAKADGGETAQRVVRLERGGTVRLHPSAMLAALIWTLFLAAEELVMMLPEEDTPGSDDLLDFSAVIAAEADLAPVTDADFDAANAEVLATFKIDETETIQTTAGDGPGQMRDVMGQQGIAMHQNAYALGLSTIAIAIGIMSEAVLLDNQRKLMESLGALNQTPGETEAAEAETLTAMAEGNDALMALLAEFLGLDLSLNTELAEMAPTPAEMDLREQAARVTADATADLDTDGALAVKAAQTVARSTTQEDAEEPAEGALALAKAAASDADDLILIAATAEDETVNMADLIKGTVQMEEFQLGQTTVMASFDLTASDASSLSDFLFIGQRTLDHDAFDDRAQAFIDFIYAKDTDVGVITLGNEIIMIDRSAFIDLTADTYSYTWETTDGQVISMIGLRTEFEQFDLIA